MSITIYDEPYNLQSPYRPFFFDCSSDDATIARVIADVYIGGTLKTTVEVDPKIGETDQFRIEVGDVVKKNLFSEFDEVSSFPENFDQTTSASDIYIRAFEVLDNGTTLDTSWSEDGAGTFYTQSSTKNIGNAILQHNQKDNVTDFLLSSSSSRFNTNRPNNKYISTDQYFYIGGSAAAAGVSSTQKIEVSEYDDYNGSGSLITTTSSSLYTPSYQKMVFGLDTSSLNSSTKSFKLRAINSALVQSSEYHTVNVIESCDDNIVIYWQNQYGIFDTHLFRGRYIEKAKIKSKSIEKRLDLNYNFSDRGEEDVKKDNLRSYEIYSITQDLDTIKWLAEIGDSTDVRIQQSINGSKEIIPINVTGITSRLEDTDAGVYQISIKYRLSNKIITHVG